MEDRREIAEKTKEEEEEAEQEAEQEEGLHLHSHTPAMSDAQQVRQEMVANAVSFLTDPTVTDTPLTKKIEFLEAKGMTNAEIQQAISHSQQQSNSHVHNHQAHHQSQSTPSQISPQQQQPQLQPQPQPQTTQYYPGQFPNHQLQQIPLPPPAPTSYDWKDYIIMGTATAGFLYGAYQVVSRYVSPKIIPPSQSKLDEDKEAMEREFERVEAILNKLESDQLDFIKRQDEKAAKIDEALIEVDAIVKATNEKNLRNEETLKYLKLEIDSIKTTLLKNLESQKSTISSELQELEKKTDSLKETLQNKISISQLSSNANATSKYVASPLPSTQPIPVPSTTPPSNLVTNNRSTASASPSTTSYSNLNIPPPSIVPSAKDILKGSTSNVVSDSPANSSSTPASPPASVTIPAWQAAAAQKSTLNDSSASIPAWQLAAQDN